MASNLKLADQENKKERSNYFREVQQELKKVSWTTKKELFRSTKIVLSFIFIFAIAIYISDLSIRSVLNIINILARAVIG